MKILLRYLFALSILSVLLALTACSTIPGTDSLVVAKQVSGAVPLDPDDAAWSTVQPKVVALYPQQTLPQTNQETDASSVTIQAIYNKKELALRLEWPDSAPADESGIDQFADAVAMQWPVHYGPGKSLPYLGMGHPGQPVALWFWRSDGTTEVLAAEGFGTLTVQPSDRIEAKSIWKDGIWRVVFNRALLSADEHSVSLKPDKQGLIPLALATWNGEAKQRDGRKLISPWQILYFEKGKVDRGYAKHLSGIPSVKGNSESGKRLMMKKNCAVCHTFPGNPKQPTVGPSLVNAGIHRSDYLLESLTEPSKIIIPGNRFSVVEGGKKRSLMPPFQGSDQERYDIVEFLKTLFNKYSTAETAERLKVPPPLTVEDSPRRGGD